MTGGYSKIFTQIFKSSIASNPEVRRLFMELLVLADRNGILDMTYEAIARVLGLPIERVINGIAELMKPDRESRSKEADGARLVLLDSHRTWGWRVVNYRKYRNRQYGDEDRKRTLARERKRRSRERKHAQSRDVTLSRDVTPGHAGSREVTFGNLKAPNGQQLRSVTVTPQAEAEAYITHKNSNTQGKSTSKSELSRDDSTKSNRPNHLNGLTDSEWLARLIADKTYAGINVQREFGKMTNWCREQRKLPTRKRFIAWLNRIEVLAQVEEAEEENLGPEGWRAAAKALFPSMQFPESFWDIQSPEVMQRIKERLANG